MIQPLLISEFLAQAVDHLIIDVRSPLEYAQGNIPGAKNIALFTDDERAVVGTLYKQAGKQQAILQGLQLVGPKLADFVQAAKLLTDKKSVFVYCWRGGMRSNSFAWLLNTYGYDVFVLESGYKSYRNFALQEFSKKLNLIVITGQTGSGKTNLLHDYASKRKQIIDLEGLACHRGSVFGGIGRTQPTQEQFENNLAFVMRNLKSQESTWIEDESRKVGKMVIPSGLWDQMRSAPIWFLEKTKEERMTLIAQEYGIFSIQDSLTCLARLEKHLGLERYEQAKELLLQGNRQELYSMLIDYYDQAYNKSLILRQKQLTASSSSLDCQDC